MIRILPRTGGLSLDHLLEGPGEAYAVVWPGVGGRYRSLHHFALAPATRVRPLRHVDSEAVYYAIAGSGGVNGVPVQQGMMWFLPPGRGYRIEAGPQGLTFVGGPCPPDPALYNPTPPAVSGAYGPPLVLDAEDEGRPLPLISKHARLVVGPWNGALMATMNYVVLEPGEGNTPHAHATSEDSLYLIAGRGSVLDGETGEELEVAADCCLHIPPGLPHAVRAGGERLVSVGGPCPPDYAMLGAAGGAG